MFDFTFTTHTFACFVAVVSGTHRPVAVRFLRQPDAILCIQFNKRKLSQLSQILQTKSGQTAIEYDI